LISDLTMSTRSLIIACASGHEDPVRGAYEGRTPLDHLLATFRSMGAPAVVASNVPRPVSLEVPWHQSLSARGDGMLPDGMTEAFGAAGFGPEEWVCVANARCPKVRAETFQRAREKAMEADLPVVGVASPSPHPILCSWALKRDRLLPFEVNPDGALCLRVGLPQDAVVWFEDDELPLRTPVASPVWKIGCDGLHPIDGRVEGWRVERGAGPSTHYRFVPPKESPRPTRACLGSLSSCDDVRTVPVTFESLWRVDPLSRSGRLLASTGELVTGRQQHPELGEISDALWVLKRGHLGCVETMLREGRFRPIMLAKDEAFTVRSRVDWIRASVRMRADTAVI